jgi:isoleucyl-tRNA synthetase
MLRRIKKFSLPEVEEKVLKFWTENQIFEKSLALRQGAKRRKVKRETARSKKFVFYEGPPTANGRPGTHHVLSRSFKDIILRFKTMSGFYVPRQGGWDTHGLPVEIEVEKELGLKSKKDIEKYGIAEFNRKCKESVWKYKDEWERLTRRIGFWLDMDNPYITYENSYIESVWGILKKVWDKKLLYKGHKVVPWCSRCGTGLSSHELVQGYDEVEDTSVIVKFQITNPKSQIKSKLQIPNNKLVYILSWTTTPWTLPGNVALAVGEKIKYQVVSVEGENEIYILAKDLVEKVLNTKYKILNTLSGKDLAGLQYEPLFKIKSLQNNKSHRVYAADFVNTEEGTGVVHTAVMYGEDDYNLGKKVGLPQHHTVDEYGKFTKEAPGLGGLYVKDKKTEEKIFKHLEKNKNLLKTEKYEHDYPFCWRCGTPLLYYARDSWFIAMSKLRSKLLTANKKINWIPEHIKEGRFGEWLREVKDWALTRERYWATPLPVWECEKCGKIKCIGSLDELDNFARDTSGNVYLMLRHGEADSNVDGIISMDVKDSIHLTERGEKEVEKAAQKLSSFGVDYIFSSDFARTKETAEIVGEKLGIKPRYDARLRELHHGEFNGRKIDEYLSYYRERGLSRVDHAVPGGETIPQVRERIMPLFFELEKKYKNKRILVISHGDPLWIWERTLSGYSNDDFRRVERNRKEIFSNYPEKGEVREVLYRKLPRDDNGVVDLHRPYVDNFFLNCVCGGKMKRVKEVIDAWFDSGAMPFASDAPGYPADYICEAVDQTRGWFYTLLATAVLLGKGNSYKNAISLGHVLDKNSQKMSKSKGNVVDPWQVVERHGADAVRWYFYTINPPGEPKRFDEMDITKSARQFISLLYNSFAFLNTYDTGTHNIKTSDIVNLSTSDVNILDKWVLARLHQVIDAATKKLNDYDIGGAAREVENFVGDLSRWYIRRSRRRFSAVAKGFGGQAETRDYKAAVTTLRYVLLETSKLIAPFTPFFAEALYKSLVNSHKSSVHLEDWPKADPSTRLRASKKLLDEMETVRVISSLALAKRAELGIKVRQPLASLKVQNPNSKIQKNKELLDILKEEINVKKIIFDAKIKEEIELDAEITHELREEGWFRELVRMVQGLRQDAGLEPKDVIIFVAELPEELKFVLQKNEKSFKKEVNARIIEHGRSEKFQAELETKMEEWPVWLALRRVEGGGLKKTKIAEPLN